ncbi:hypothetical protein [Enterococcus termitis]|uniref:Uncharacterized protein n=1 Tax=Enterococcus termitis TaxID=332950 RepID=A0A1E5GW27_9ENTE|nr:hypothetical protein [Enterococcus termitis]OEG16845.1 hypothetical protein BCR25_04405 [Enterococcus termitis]OJG99560.1 hypothetical protein RV18_GL001628 [Enterococcus termitis]
MKRIKVHTKSELLAELKKKTDEILVEGDLTQNLAEIKKGQLNYTETMGVTGGSGVIFEYGISKILELFDPSPKEDKIVRRHIERLYVIKQLSAASFLLHLKQLDY